jgi:hypothetical protein
MTAPTLLRRAKSEAPKTYGGPSDPLRCWEILDGSCKQRVYCQPIRLTPVPVSGSPDRIRRFLLKTSPSSVCRIR